jgi:hypothetical protein
VPAAVKVLQLPAAAAGVGLAQGLGGAQGGLGFGRAAADRREQMAVMETALGTSIRHPNLVQVSTAAQSCAGGSTCCSLIHQSAATVVICLAICACTHPGCTYAGFCGGVHSCTTETTVEIKV